jgi:hypothetical protein
VSGTTWARAGDASQTTDTMAVNTTADHAPPWTLNTLGDLDVVNAIRIIGRSKREIFTFGVGGEHRVLGQA